MAGTQALRAALSPPNNEEATPNDRRIHGEASALMRLRRPCLSQSIHLGFCANRCATAHKDSQADTDKQATALRREAISNMERAGSTGMYGYQRPATDIKN